MKEQEFWQSAIRDERGCWVWQRSTNRGGYGNVYFDGRSDGSHRVAWRLTHGRIPTGMYVLHHCDNPPCVNPEHLFVGTQKDNIRDAHRKGRTWQKRRTHCPRGHSYSKENTRIVGTGRWCKTCAYDANKASDAKMRKDPTRYAAYLEYQRQYQRRRREAYR